MSEELANCNKSTKIDWKEKIISDSDIDISDGSHQLAVLIESIQEYEDRWIELSELSESDK